jgi:hypothetical protein
VTIDVEVTRARERRQHVPLEVVARPVAEHRLLQHEEAGVDPVVGQHRLLPERDDPVFAVEVEGAVLRPERDDRDGGAAAGLDVPLLEAPRSTLPTPSP